MLKRCAVQMLLVISVAFCSGAFAQEGDENYVKPPLAGRNAVIEGSEGYVKQWIPFPEISGESVVDGSTITHNATVGRVTVVVFLASWCDECQQLIEHFRTVEKKYERLHTDFIYVFSHDTAEDSRGFMKEYKIKTGILANHEILKAFRNPELPSIYIGDRHSWLADRYIKATEEDVRSLEKFLRYMTAF